MMFNDIFTNDHLYSVIGGGNRNTKRKPLTLYHIMLHQVHLAMIGFEHITLVVGPAGYTGSFEFSYNTVTTTTTHF